MKNCILSFLVLIAINLESVAQSTDLARVEYLNIPFSKSNNSISRYRVFAQAPIPLNKELTSFFVVGLEYRYHSIDIQDEVPFDPKIISSVQRMDAYVGYVQRIENDWVLGGKMGGRIASNLKDGPSGDDYIFEGGVYAVKDRKNDTINTPWRLILGLTYSTTPGRNYPLPLINYYREFRPNWTYTLGVPKTNVRHYLNDSHKDALQAYVTLDNFFGNLQENIIVNGKPAENVSMTTVIAGLGYEHYFTDHLLFYGYGAHTIYTEFRLRDNNRETAYIINEDNSLYFRAGLKFKY